MAVSNKPCVIGADLGGTNLRLALADQDGTILARWSTSTVGIRDPHFIVDLIKSGVDHLLQQTSTPRAQLCAIAVGAPGVTDAQHGIVLITSYLLGWRNVPLRALLEAEFNIPAAIENDVNLAALGESSYGAAKDTPNFVFLAIGTGIGAGILLNGKLFQGSTWIAGEIGYMLVPGVSEQPADQSAPRSPRSPRRGRRHPRPVAGRLEPQSYATPRRPQSHPGPRPRTNRPTCPGHPRSHRPSPRLRHLQTSLLSSTARLSSSGGRIGMHPGLCIAIRNLLAERGPRAIPTLAQSTLGEDAQLLGAIRLALDTAAINKEQ